MRTGLERQLTLSHLAVTVLSVAILAILILIGYVVYLRTDWAARWTGEAARYFAEELFAMVDDAGARQLDAEMAQTFVDGFVTPADASDGFFLGAEEAAVEDFANSAEWLLVLAPDGTILASNYPSRYPVGENVRALLPPGFKGQWLRERTSGRAHYALAGAHYVGLAPVLDMEERLLGWVYYRASNDSALILSDTARLLGWALLGAALIAVVVAAIAGTLLARRFSRRLQQVNRASIAFAEGEWDRRVTLAGDDEIAQLGRHFNRMADRIAAQMRDLRQLAEDNARLAEEARALATLEERNRLARDLHDAIKQQLFGLNLLAGSIRPLLDTDGGLARARLDQLVQLVGRVLEEMDAIIRQLRPASLADKGLPEALRTFAAQWSERTDIPVEVQVSQARQIPMTVEQALYRVAQEALSNVARHAAAENVVVSLGYDADAVELTITDDGDGFAVDAPRSPASFGLASMAERMEQVGGQLFVESQPGVGTTVQAWIDWT